MGKNTSSQLNDYDADYNQANTETINSLSARSSIINESFEPFFEAKHSLVSAFQFFTLVHFSNILKCY